MTDGPADPEFVFVLKVSKFCNLRCSYCYEHRELDVLDRMDSGTLEVLFSGIDSFGDHLSAFGISPTFSFVWHGGEPLLVQPEYYRHAAALQQSHIRRFPFRNSVQTNLYGSMAPTLAHVLASGWQLGVSIDFAANVRGNHGNRDSNAKVIENAEALHGAGGRFGVVSVLGKHNARSIAESYDWVKEFATGWRILPVFDGGPDESFAKLRLTNPEIVRVFCEIFERRSQSGKCIPIDPIDSYASVAMLKLMGERSATRSFENVLDTNFIVNVNGDVYTRPFAYQKRYCIGNINRTGMAGLIRSGAYARCQSTLKQDKRDNCAGCDHLGYCDSSPIHEHWSVTTEGSRRLCAYPRLAIDAIEDRLREKGVDRATIRGWARAWLDGSLDEAESVCA
jgi:uncharacterized protein